MRKFYFLSALCLATVLTVSGCKSTTPPEDLRPVAEALDDPSGANGAYGSGSGLDSRGGSGFDSAQGGSWRKGADENSIGGAGADADGWTVADPSGNRLGMPIIYFKYDSDELIDQERKKLDAIADFMANNAVLGVVIEGHCDQRGTDEYNRALGERRANAVRAYLAGRGVADNRMKTVSYGKDKPAVEGSGEEVWKQNRRGVPVPMRMGR